MSINIFLFSTFLSVQYLSFAQRKITNYDVISYKLDLSILIDNQSIAGSNDIFFKTVKATKSIEVHLAKQFKIQSINKNNQKLNFSRRNDTISISFNEKLEKGSFQTVSIKYSGKPKIAENPPWDGGFVWEKDSIGRPWVGVSCEGIGASTWWPCNNDIADKADSIKINVKIAKTSDSLKVICNGRLSAIKNEKDSTTFQWLIGHPVTNYNLTLNIGGFEQIHENFIPINKEPFSVDYYVLDYHKNLAKQHFKQVPIILGVFEHLYGPYPFSDDGYALIETSYWGMEHQSGISYGNKFINNAMGFDFIILHESGHEYWGNAVGINDFAELWINETFTTYTETLFFEQFYSKEQAFKYLQRQKLLIQNTEPLLRKTGVSYEFESTDIYYKGAWMLHTIRTALNNDEQFLRILKDIQLNYKYKTISTSEVLSVFKKHINSFNVEQVMMHYLTRIEYPQLKFSHKKRRNKHTFQFQWKEVSETFNLPIWVNNDGEKLLVNPHQKIIGKKIEVLWLQHYLIKP